MTSYHVIGDVMLDVYLFGNVERVSPEAPVPILLHTNSKKSLGGAANVAQNLKALGAHVHLYSLVSDDHAGVLIQNLLKEVGIDNTIFSGLSRTTVKTRHISQGNHLLRVDREGTVETCQVDNLIEAVKNNVKKDDVLLISDYNKGIIYNSSICDELNKNDSIKVFVDPKGKDFSKYHGNVIITPNANEFKEAFGHFGSQSELVSLAREAIRHHGFHAILVTLSEKGAIYISSEEVVRAETATKDFADVTGAGDVFLANFCFSSTQFPELSIEDHLKTANYASFLSLSTLGTAAPSFNEIYVDKKSKKIVFTNGCFDLIHAGHINTLETARQFGDYLIVGLNSDASVKELKGLHRPIVNQCDRKKILESLECVDEVRVFDELTPLDLIKSIKPDVLVKGADYSGDEIVGADFVQSYGGVVKTVELVNGYSTTELIKRINNEK